MSQLIAATFLLSCAAPTQTEGFHAAEYAAGTGPSENLDLPAPFDTPSARNNSKVIGWPQRQNADRPRPASM